MTRVVISGYYGFANAGDEAMLAAIVGSLKDITPYGATFQPLDLKGYQKEKA